MSAPFTRYLHGALSLKGRLLLGLFVTWAVVLALLLGFGWRSAETLAGDSSRTHLRYEARLIADELTQQVDSRLSALQRLAGRVPLRASSSEARNVLRDSDALLEWFEGLFVVGAEGRVMADWPNVEGRVGLNIADREYFQEVAAFHEPYVSEPFRGRASHQSLVVFVVPRLDVAGNFQGMVGGIVNIRNGDLFNRLSRIRLGLEGFASVMTASGQVLYHPDRSRILAEVPDAGANPWANLSLFGWEGEVLGELSSGDLGYQAYRQIWPADWIVSVVLPRDQVLSPLMESVGRLGWWALLVAGLMMPIMGWFVWLSLRPLYRLERQIEEVGAGKRNQVALATRMQELQRVAFTFNRVEVERGHALARSRERQAFLDAILSSSPVGIFVTEPGGAISYVNPALVELTGYQEIATNPLAWLNRVHADDRQAMQELWRHSLQSGEDFLQQYRYWHRKGEVLWLEVHARRVSSEDGHLGFVGTVKDITQRREEEALRQWEAEHDPLTGLLNRRGLERRLEEALADWRKMGIPSVLLVFDMDHFKPINDLGGHALGDEMLCRVARELTQTIRRSDHAARQGGDEFAVLLPSCSPEQARRIAESLLESTRLLRVHHEGQAYSVTMSVGATSFQNTDQRISQIIQRADEACYEAKRAGRDGVAIRG
ncbi:diguanylate cyclase [Halomonas sp. 18H]|uniref:sensor domain-containing diguanylate cyclase n=1 Tax=Halomonas almeriensis TaxID=308163 RepID=UPI00222E618A|nr:MULTISPECIES: diguanylate cyclase [Halomonas]MCW4149491.1 diguanylate cyclase [Halomonas sp. 18H]MDN3553563.1 diguanylate cyclase [Halomonas almeriensis]